VNTRQGPRPQPQRVSGHVVDADAMPQGSKPVMHVKLANNQTVQVNSMFAANCPEETGDGRWKITFAFDGETHVGISPSVHDAVVQVMDSVKRGSADAMTAFRQYLTMWRDAMRQKEEGQCDEKA